MEQSLSRPHTAPTESPDIGHVIEVNGERALVELTADTTRPLADSYYPGQPGSHVKIPFMNQNIIGIVSSVRVVNNGNGNGSGAHKVAECVLVGTLDPAGRFGRGVAVYPNVGQKVEMVANTELKKILSEYAEFDYSFGRPCQASTERAYIQVDRFFGQHVAVLGTTGSGKSCTVVSILQRAVQRYPNAHIIVLDLHGEYASAFPEHAQVIEADKVELPYWLLNFDEFCDLAVDPNEFTAKNQITVLRDAIVRARQTADREQNLGLGKALTVDSPVCYDIEEVLGQVRSWNIQMVCDPNGRMAPGPLYGVFDRFLIRLESKTSDPRFGFIFGGKTANDDSALPRLLRDYLSIENGKRIAVVDLSGVPSEALGVVVAVVCRVAYEFNFWNPDRDKFPMLLVLEEAHNYIPSRPDPRFSTARAAVERIAKEGRKYGIGAIVVSQRPKELSETVVSQCNTFIAMRLTNPDDQAYVRHLVPDSLAGLLAMLPALRTGEALILGDAVPMPSRVMVDCPDPKPMSEDAQFNRWWSDTDARVDLDRVIRRWRCRSKNL